MGWADCGDDEYGRPIGYAFEGWCDQPGCSTLIDRGLAYCCGDMHDGGEHGCGKYFCYEHLSYMQLCPECQEEYDKEHPEEDEEKNSWA